MLGKEVKMAVKVLIRRQFKPGHLKDASILLNKIRYGAMGQKGYISSETLSGYEDQNRILVTSMWQELENWKNWRNSEQRKALDADFEKILDGPPEYETFYVGMQEQ
jgi:heme-degrading monooxygenase HmoA